MIRLGIIGDVHLQFNDRDVDYFNQSELDVLLFVGDLAKYTGRGGRRISRVLGQLTKPSFVIPGNHDNVSAVQMLMEALGVSSIAQPLGRKQAQQHQRFEADCSPVVVCGYSVHPIREGAEGFDLIAGRPHSMGGHRVHFQRYLSEVYGVSTMEDSKRLLRQCVDQSTQENVVFLAHNGPSGLGARREDIWGCDFRAEEGDHGDPDLEDAIAYAKGIGKRVLLVAAGHMHHRLRGGGEREWCVHRDAIHYVNAACVPRIEVRDGARWHHHVQVDLKGDTVTVKPVVIRHA